MGKCRWIGTVSTATVTLVYDKGSDPCVVLTTNEISLEALDRGEFGPLDFRTF